jgi:hypothetical protein
LREEFTVWLFFKCTLPHFNNLQGIVLHQLLIGVILVIFIEWWLTNITMCPYLLLFGFLPLHFKDPFPWMYFQQHFGSLLLNASNKLKRLDFISIFYAIARNWLCSDKRRSRGVAFLGCLLSLLLLLFYLLVLLQIDLLLLLIVILIFFVILYHIQAKFLFGQPFKADPFYKSAI